MKSVGFIVCVILTTLTAVTAAPVDPRLIPESARWVLHADFAAIKASSTGRTLLEAGLDQEAARQLDMAKALFSVDPREDIDSLTAFASGPSPDEAVLILNGRFDGERLTALVETIEGYTSESHGGVLVHGWLDAASGLRHYGAVPDDRMLMLGTDADGLKAVLDVRGGEARNITQAGPRALPLEPFQAPGTLIGLSADLRGIKLDQHPLLAAVEGTERVALRIAESVTDGFTLSADIQRATAEQAAELEQMVRGLLIMGSFQAQQEQPELAHLLRAVTAQAAGRSLRLHLRYPADKMVALIQGSIAQAVQE